MCEGRGRRGAPKGPGIWRRFEDLCGLGCMGEEGRSVFFFFGGRLTYVPAALAAPDLRFGRGRKRRVQALSSSSVTLLQRSAKGDGEGPPPGVSRGVRRAPLQWLLDDVPRARGWFSTRFCYTLLTYLVLLSPCLSRSVRSQFAGVTSLAVLVHIRVPPRVGNFFPRQGLLTHTHTESCSHCLLKST